MTEEMVFMKGTIGSKFYIIIRGGCEVYTSEECNGQEVMITKLSKLRELSEGDSFGEAALVETSQRKTTVISKYQTTCLSLSIGGYQKHLSVDYDYQSIHLTL